MVLRYDEGFFLNSSFIAFIIVGIFLVVGARYSSREKIAELGRVILRATYEDLSKEYFDPLLLFVYSLVQGSLIGLALGFLFTSPIPYQNPNPLIALYCIIALPLVRINYEFTLVAFKFLKRPLKVEVQKEV